MMSRTKSQNLLLMQGIFLRFYILKKRTKRQLMSKNGTAYGIFQWVWELFENPHNDIIDLKLNYLRVIRMKKKEELLGFVEVEGTERPFHFNVSDFKLIVYPPTANQWIEDKFSILEQFNRKGKEHKWIEMHRLYEKFILEFYKTERKDLSANAIQIPWMLDDDYSEMLPVMQTGITLTKENITFIIDAKYYAHSTQSQFNSNTLHSGNLYQIFTYVKNRTEQVKESGGEVSGMLLYAKTDENITPNNNEYSMSGNKITVHSLDLDRNFEDIKQELNEIADRCFCA